LHKALLFLLGTPEPINTLLIEVPLLTVLKQQI